LDYGDGQQLRRAAHLTGIVARILGKHPGLTLFQMKTVLRALSANMPHH
jgi:hypothetical protein